MNRSEIRNLVIANLASHLHVLEQKVSEEAELFEDLGADSLDVVELTLLFEEMFHVEISDDDLEQSQTVGQIIDLIEKKVSTSMVEEQNEQGRPDEELQKVPDTEADEQPEADEAEEGDEGEGDESESENEEE